MVTDTDMFQLVREVGSFGLVIAAAYMMVKAMLARQEAADAFIHRQMCQMIEEVAEEVRGLRDCLDHHTEAQREEIVHVDRVIRVIAQLILALQKQMALQDITHWNLDDETERVEQAVKVFEMWINRQDEILEMLSDILRLRSEAVERLRRESP